MSQIKPMILLHSPQLGENIGAAARAMLNFGLTDLRLIAPRDGWPNPAADTLSAGAFEAGVTVSVFDTLEAATGDLSTLIAATARPRGMEKPVFDTPGTLEFLTARGVPTGILFGAENNGLPSAAVALCDAILTYPVNPDFASLNLAQAVAVFAAAWGQNAGDQGRWQGEKRGVEAPAPKADLIGMFEHLEAELTRAGYFFPPEKTELMTINIRNAFLRGNWTVQEVRTFRGIVKALALGRGKARITRSDGD